MALYTRTHTYIYMYINIKNLHPPVFLTILRKIHVRMENIINVAMYIIMCSYTHMCMYINRQGARSCSRKQHACIECIFYICVFSHPTLYVYIYMCVCVYTSKAHAVA